MNKLELELHSSYNCKFAYFGKKYQKQDINHDTIKIQALYGALAFLCLYNDELLNEYKFTMHDIINSACICDSELRLHSFEGYWVSDRLKLDSLYINQYNCIILSAYDIKKDRYIDFVM